MIESDFLREYILLSVLKNHNIYGRKKLQKIVYFVNLIGWDSFHDYRFHHFGPFSDDLVREIENLQENKLIDIKENKKNDIVSYEHAISEKGKRFFLQLNQDNDQILINKTTEMVDELNNFSARELEIISSINFLKKEYKNCNEEEVLLKLKEIKPHLKDKEISDANVAAKKILEKYIPS